MVTSMPSGSVRTPLSATGMSDSTIATLEYICEHYDKVYGLEGMQPTELNRIVATALSNQVNGKLWTYRYIVSVRTGKLPPSRWLVRAIEKLHRKVERAKKAKTPPTLRCTFYPTTATDKIIADLLRVTGKVFEVKG